MILSIIIVAQHFPPKIAIMTSGHTTVLIFIKAAGGTTVANTQISMVCTSMGRTIPKACAG